MHINIIAKIDEIVKIGVLRTILIIKYADI